MSLAPTGSAQLGNLRYESQLLSVWCHLGLLPAVNRARVVLPADVRFEAGPGDPAELILDGGDGAGSGGSATVLTGQVLTVRRSHRTIEAVIGDAGRQLATSRPALTFTGQDGAAVIRALAGGAGAELSDAGPDLPLAVYVAHQGRTAAEHVAALAELAGGFAVVEADGRLAVRPRPTGPADLALLWGRELVRYEVHHSPPGPAQPVAVGFGPAGSTSEPGVLRPSHDALSNGAADPGPDALWEPSPVLRVPAAVRTATEAAAARSAASGTRLTATCFLLPAVRAGAVVEVQQVPDGLDGGPWLVTGITHQLRADGGGSSVITAETAGAAASAGGLLSSLVGAVGGLL
jgi:hypothetical protein